MVSDPLSKAKFVAEVRAGKNRNPVHLSRAEILAARDADRRGEDSAAAPDHEPAPEVES